MPKYIVGIDEAGRGPLAGPVTVGAVAVLVGVRIMLPDRDSKKLNPKKRDLWFAAITANPKLLYSVVSISHSIIDKKGISYALRIGVERCLEKINSKIASPKSKFKVLLDGSLYAPAAYRQKTIIKGDEKIPIISAASVIAKVTRDRKMIKLAKKYPNYAFEIHKGYGTKMHYELITKYGLSRIHRKSYCKKTLLS